MLVVPGEWSNTTVQFLVTASDDDSEGSFYKNVVRQSPFRKLKDLKIVHTLKYNMTFTMYRKILAYNALNLLKPNSDRTTYNASQMQNDYDAAIGYVPQIAHLVTHSVIKKNQRSVCLNKQLVNTLKVDDSIAVKMVSKLVRY